MEAVCATLVSVLVLFICISHACAAENPEFAVVLGAWGCRVMWGKGAPGVVCGGMVVLFCLCCGSWAGC